TGDLERRANLELVELSPLDTKAEAKLRRLLVQHAERTGSAKVRALLAGWEAARRRFTAITPRQHGEVDVVWSQALATPAEKGEIGLGIDAGQRFDVPDEVGLVEIVESRDDLIPTSGRLGHEVMERVAKADGPGDKLRRQADDLLKEPVDAPHGKPAQAAEL